MSNSLDCLPNFGIYQGLHPESREELTLLASIAEQRANEYLQGQKINANLCVARPAFGFTLTSHKDVRRSSGTLSEGRFSLLDFTNELDQVLPLLPAEPQELTGNVVSKACRSFGLEFNLLGLNNLLTRARVVRTVADSAGAAVLPVRQYFGHIGVLDYGEVEPRTKLSGLHKGVVRGIIGSVGAELGIKSFRFGDFVVGTQIDQPLEGTPKSLGSRFSMVFSL